MKPVLKIGAPVGAGTVTLASSLTKAGNYRTESYFKLFLLSLLLFFSQFSSVVSQGILYPVIYYFTPAKYTGVNLAKVEVLSFSTTYHTGSNTFIYPGISYSSTNQAEIRAIKSDATLVGTQLNQALYSSNGVLVGGGNQMFIAGLNNGIFMTQVVNMGATTTFFSVVGMFMPGHNMGLGYSLNDGTSSIVFVGSRNGGVVRAFDSAASCTKTLETRTIQGLVSSQMLEFLNGNSILVATKLTSLFAVLQKVDLKIVSSIATVYPNKANTFKVDPMSSSRTLIASMSVLGSFKLDEVDFTGLGIPSITKSLSLTVQANSIAFVRTLDFVLLGLEQEQIRLLRRSNILDTTVPTLNVPLRSSIDSLSCCEVAGTKSVFSLVGGGEAYYYYFEETYCLNPLSVPCDECQAGYYLTDSFYCLDPPNFPVSKGISGKFMKSCVDPNCLACVNNVNVCTVCDSANFWYLFGSVCVKNIDIKATYGANLATGQVSACTDTNCKDCRMSHNICVWCNDDYSLSAPSPAGTCLLNTGLPTTFGPNPATGVMTTCQTPNCDKCKRIYTECDFCNLGFSVFSASYCIPYNLIDDLKGPNLITGGISTCAVANCNKCKVDHTICDFCVSLYSLENNYCTSFPLIVDNRGPNLVTGRITDCAVANCRKCKNDHLICDLCHDAWGLQTNLCPLIATLPPNFGINLSNGWVQFCADRGCNDCRFDKNICTSCMKDYYFDENRTCTYVKDIPDRYGANLTTNFIDRCQVDNCVYCKQDASKCVGCIENYELDLQGQCVRLTYRIQVNLEENKLYPFYQDSDLSMFITFNDSKLAVKGDYFNRIVTMKEELFQTELYEADSGTKVDAWKALLKVGTPWQNNTLVLGLFNKALLPQQTYVVRVFAPQVVRFEKGDDIFGFDVFDFNFTLHNNQPLERIQAYASLGSLARLAIADPGARPWLLNLFQVFKYVLVYFDPSGFVARYFHFCQRVQRFSQFNVNFGPEVSSFLTSLNEYESVMANQSMTLKGLQMLKGSQGKSDYIETDFYVATFPKVLTYLILWSLRVLVEFLRHNFDRFPSWFYNMLFYLQRLHFSLVALCLMDFLGFSFRVIITGADWMQITLAYLLIVTLSWDLVEAAHTICEPWRWIKRLREIEICEKADSVFEDKLHAEAEELEFVDKRLEKAKISEEKLAQLKKVQLIHESDTKHRYVNNFETQENIDINFTCLRYLDGPLKTNKKVALSTAARLNESIHLSRMMGFTLITYLAPYAKQPGILALLGLEGLVMIYVTTVYIAKKGHLRNIVLLLVEISRSCLMGLFLLITFQIRDRKRSEPFDEVSDSRGSLVLFAMMILEFVNLIFQVPYYWMKRRVEPSSLISYDRYLWKKGDNFFGEDSEQEMVPPAAPVEPQIFLDQKNHDGLCISIDTVAQIKARALLLQKDPKKLKFAPQIQDPKSGTNGYKGTIQDAIHLGLTGDNVYRENIVSRKKPKRRVYDLKSKVAIQQTPKDQFGK